MISDPAQPVMAVYRIVSLLRPRESKPAVSPDQEDKSLAIADDMSTGNTLTGSTLIRICHQGSKQQYPQPSHKDQNRPTIFPCSRTHTCFLLSPDMWVAQLKNSGLREPTWYESWAEKLNDCLSGCGRVILIQVF